MKKNILFCLFTLSTYTTFATINFISAVELGSPQRIVIQFDMNTSLGQGAMAQIRYTPPGGGADVFTGFVAGSYLSVGSGGLSRFQVTILIGTGTNQVPLNSTNLAIECAKTSTDGGTNGVEYTGVQSSYASALVTPLPVTLTKFSGKQSERSIALTWETQNETNNDFFAIQHSKDLKSWENIGEVVGKGTIEQTQAYGFVHTLPTTGANYYRLKQVDFNGQFEFSKVIAVQMPSNPTLMVFPNPAADFIQISGIETTTGLQLVSISGEVIIEKQISENTTLSLKNLSNGTYFVRFLDKTSSQTKKIILNR